MRKHEFEHDTHKDDGTVCSMCRHCGEPLDDALHFIYVCLDGCGRFNGPTIRKWFRRFCAECGHKATRVSGAIAKKISDDPNNITTRRTPLPGLATK